ncbi:MAG: TetR/AcrR family transcriptional regulator [Hyphomicrobiaceae bacterium]|nr:TetR/AcrR family transcriptional regulator [Hyphomicrobiaceae bacterium]
MQFDDQLTIKKNRHELRTQETRAQLIEAAIACLAENGFSGTTTAKIAARAGVTTGALHHNYDTKEELYLAVLETMSVLNTDSILPIDRALKGGPDGLCKMVELLWKNYGSQRYWAVWEINIGFRSNPELRRRVSESRRRFASMFRQRLFEEGEALDPKVEEQIFEIVSVMLASIRGLFLDSLMDLPKPLIHRQLRILGESTYRSILDVMEVSPGEDRQGGNCGRKPA